jgi:endonuclease/exonuclease/phosphatase (EEP) superfamily protein YafD
MSGLIESARAMTSPAPGQENHRTRRAMVGRALFVMVLALWAAWLIGQIVQDRTWLTGLCFYVPSVAVAALSLALAIGCIRVRARRRSLAAIALMVPPLVMTIAIENRWTRAPLTASGAAPLRAVHWNIGYGIYGWAQVKTALVREHADLVVVSEAPRKATGEILASTLGPGYTGLRISSMAVMARGALRNVRRWANDDQLKAYSVTWDSVEGPIEILAVDVASNVLMARDPVLRRVSWLIEQTQPDLVVGDFNAPRRSRALNPPPPGYVHAYEAAGRGWSATWPLPCPMLAIDQCLLGRRIEPIRYDLLTARGSDHRAQVLDFRLRSGAADTESRRSSSGEGRR